ncbi:MAG TPA: hypothetical protein VGV38_09815 [Pyrinomonadaceae bacterium]|nr:hypothetical protein [Pyrinomonadaceae bacterium]
MKATVFETTDRAPSQSERNGLSCERGARSRARFASCVALVVAILVFAFAVSGAGRAASGASYARAAAADEAGARRALEEAFRMLRAGDFGGLYDALPSASQRRVTRARFVESLNRARGAYELERMEVTAAHVAGDLAAFDTVVYGRALRPIVAEGKIVARQYLVREGGRWRVTTGDRQTVRPLLAAHPALARRFPFREPRVYVKRDGRWMALTLGSRR